MTEIRIDPHKLKVPIWLVFALSPAGMTVLHAICLNRSRANDYRRWLAGETKYPPMTDWVRAWIQRSFANCVLGQASDRGNEPASGPSMTCNLIDPRESKVPVWVVFDRSAGPAKIRAICLYPGLAKTYLHWITQDPDPPSLYDGGLMWVEESLANHLFGSVGYRDRYYGASPVIAVA